MHAMLYCCCYSFLNFNIIDRLNVLWFTCTMPIQNKVYLILSSSLVWCGMPKLEVLAQIDFIVFLTFLGVK